MNLQRLRGRTALLALIAMMFLGADGVWGFCHQLELVQHELLRFTAPSKQPVHIDWFGHATFQITSSKGTRILTDPHTREHLPWPTSPQNIVTTSHNHWAHSNIDMAYGDPIVLDGLNEEDDWNKIHINIADVSIYTVPAYHDKSQGFQRGKNAIFVFRVDGICIAHLGDLGHRLTQQQLKKLGKIDVLLVPIGGGRYTITAREGREVTKQVAPRIAIPMHYSWEGAEAPYIEGHKRVRKINHRRLSLERDKLPQPTEIVVLDWSRP